MKTHLEYAFMSLDYVRNNIKPNQCANKRLSGQDTTHDQIDVLLGDMQLNSSIFRYDLESHIAYGEKALLAHIGNCAETSCAAIAYLYKDCGYDNFDIVEYRLTEHTFVVLGASLQDRYFHDFHTWHPEVAICDPWADIACLAKDYPNRWRLRMDNWHIMRMRLLVADAALQPRHTYWYEAPSRPIISLLRRGK